eukprot:380517-Amphidinium_carterae.2
MPSNILGICGKQQTLQTIRRVLTTVRGEGKLSREPTLGWAESWAGATRLRSNTSIAGRTCTERSAVPQEKSSKQFAHMKQSLANVMKTKGNSRPRSIAVSGAQLQLICSCLSGLSL